MSLTHTQVLSMLKMQDEMNTKVNPAWLTAGYPFLRAVVVEATEAIEHHGWKWWRKQDKDLPQLQMELVDIWHFLLSDYLVKANKDLDRAANAVLSDRLSKPEVLLDGKCYSVEPGCDMVAHLELLIGLAACRRTSIPLFEALLTDCGLSWDTLYRQYVGKNVLNFFRQDHGYQSGTYQKEWHGREDNQHLVEVLAGLDASSSLLREQVYAGLASRYPGIPVHGTQSNP